MCFCEASLQPGSTRIAAARCCGSCEKEGMLTTAVSDKASWERRMAHEGGGRRPFVRLWGLPVDPDKCDQEWANRPETLDEKLHVAAHDGDHQEVKLLLDEGADPNWPNPYMGDNQALVTAVEARNPDTVEVVRTLLKHGAHTAGENSATPLHHSARTSKEVVEALIEAGADLAATDSTGSTPLHWAESKEVVETLVGAGANVAAVDDVGRSPLHHASTKNKEVVEALIKAEASVTVPDTHGNTPLHESVNTYFPRTGITAALLAAGADVGARNTDGNTPLHIWAQNRPIIIVGQGEDSIEGMLETLISAGADVDTTNNIGRTPLHYSGSRAVVEALVGAGANVKVTDNDGWTPLHSVCSLGPLYSCNRKGVVSALVAAGADVHARDKNGNTALHAASKERLGFHQIDELVAAGADLDCTNNAGQTPRDVATLKAKLALDRARLAREQFEVQVPPDRVMLMFCGNGMVGKTSLTKALEHGKVDPARPIDGRTYGFDSFKAVIPHAGECTMVDFGGQPEFWVPHGTFLGNRSGVYLAVVNLGDPPSTQRSQLRHWLRFIVSRSEGDTRPQVAVVGSHRGAAQAIKAQLKEESDFMLPDEKKEFILRLKQLKSITTRGQQRICSTLQDTTQRFHAEFVEKLDVAPKPFLIESVDPDEMDSDELTRLQQWLRAAFDHIRDTRKVPQVCLQVAELVVTHLRPTLPPISTYDTVMAALKEAAGGSIDFSDDVRNRAIMSHLWEAGHLMVFEDVADTVVVNPQAFGTHVIGQLFCPHGDPDFQSLVVNKKGGFVFRTTQLEAHLKEVRARGCDFGDATLALKLMTALELIIPLPATPDTVDDPVFAIPGRLNQGDAVLEEYRRRPSECWSERTHDSWVYLGVRLKLASRLTLIPPSEFPRLQHRLSKKTGFRMWRHGLCVRRYTPRGLIEVEGLIELDLTLEHIDVCVRSEAGAEEACTAELLELVEVCQRVSPDFECAMLTSESLKKHVDTERVVADGVGPQLGMGARGSITAFSPDSSAAAAPLTSTAANAAAPAPVGSLRKRRRVDTMKVDGEAGPAARQDALQPVEWLAATLGPTRQQSNAADASGAVDVITVVVSCPETASLTGGAPFDLNVFEHCERLREAGRILLAFDRPRQPEVGLEGTHPADAQVIWSMDAPVLAGKSAEEKWAAVQASVKGSVWFHGFRGRVKGAILAIAQAHTGRAIRLICIKGGPVTSLEQQEMSTINYEVERELDEISLRAHITVGFLSYSKFSDEFP